MIARINIQRAAGPEKSEVRSPKAEGNPKAEVRTREFDRAKSRFTVHGSPVTHHPSRPSSSSSSLHPPAFSRAFTLIEVMVACGIFFMATFAILALVSGTLRNARSLQKGYVDAGMAASQVFQIFKTNTDPDLSAQGDFGDALRGYTWDANSQEYDTNGLLQVDIKVYKGGVPIDKLSILVYQANTKSSGFGAPRMR
jgi:type II secretion system protein I